MAIQASAAELAFYAARVGLAADALHPALAVALADGPVVADSDVINAIEVAPKPVRITGTAAECILRIRVSSVASDPDAARRFQIRNHNLGGDRPPLLDPETADNGLLLVIAFDHLLKVSGRTWREFIRDYWVDGGLGWSADWPTSEWARACRLPRALVREAGAVVLLGYGTPNGQRSPCIPDAWEAA